MAINSPHRMASPGVNTTSPISERISSRASPFGLRLGQRFSETDHLGAVVLSDIRMYVRQIGRSLGETRLDLDLLLRQLPHPHLHAWGTYHPRWRP